DARQGLGVGIQVDPVVPFVPVADRQAELRQTTRGRVTVVARVLRRLDQLLHDRLRRRDVRVAHAEVDDILPGAAGSRLEVVDHGEDIGGKAPNASELHAHESKARAGDFGGLAKRYCQDPSKYLDNDRAYRQLSCHHERLNSIGGCPTWTGCRFRGSRMMRRILKALFSVALAAATFGLPAPGAAGADSPVTVQVEGGYGGVVPQGGWAPIQVDVTNHGR